MTEALVVDTLTAIGILVGVLPLLLAIFMGMWDD